MNTILHSVLLSSAFFVVSASPPDEFRSDAEVRAAFPRHAGPSGQGRHVERDGATQQAFASLYSLKAGEQASNISTNMSGQALK